MTIQNIQQPFIPQQQDPDVLQATQGQAGATVASTSNTSALTATQQASLVASQGGSLPAQGTVAAQAGQPALPDVQGASRSSASTTSAASSAIGWLQLKPFHLASSLNQLGDTLRDNAIAQGQIRRAASQNEYTAMNASAAEQVAEVQGERKSAWIQMGAAVGAAVVSSGSAALGASASLETKFATDLFGEKGLGNKALGPLAVKNTPVVGAGLTAGGAALGQLVTQTGALADRLSGGQHEADEAKMAKAMQDVLVAAYKSRDDDFASATQNAQQALQNVLVDLRKEINSNNNDTARNIIQSV